jgi:hypothetical protein
VLFYVLFVSIVLFYVLFVCKCVLYYCHRLATLLQLNISYISGHHIYVSKSVMISGYFSKPKWVRDQKLLGHTALHQNVKYLEHITRLHPESRNRHNFLSVVFKVNKHIIRQKRTYFPLNKLQCPDLSISLLRFTHLPPYIFIQHWKK